MFGYILVSFAFALSLLALPAETPQPENSGKLADRHFTVSTPRGTGAALYFGSGSLDGNSSTVRAIVIVHGILRDADYYYDTGTRAIANARASNTLLIAPQFIEAGDLKGNIQRETLRWNDDWPGGSDAAAPAPISTYDVFDAMIERLADRSRFPHLQEIVLVGHSAGGQIVQRYAAVGKAPQLGGLARGPRVHLIVSNPSSYFYFDDTRPLPHPNCVDFSRWRYGLAGAPPYVRGDAAQLEARYVIRHVTYLLGTGDVNPQENDLDRSCAAEAQGAFRFVRGKNFIAYLKSRHPHGTAQDYAFVRGVGHDNRRMFNSACGIGAIFRRSESSCAKRGTI
ncbi:MAG: alpha/beta hydrolase [Candidatus Eremiobacteraeota bacterium]|nr:alpha/beta hydrolase [Candidatus Eremiobacteraeota bacterium]